MKKNDSKWSLVVQRVAENCVDTWVGNLFYCAMPPTQAMLDLRLSDTESVGPLATKIIMQRDWQLCLRSCRHK